MKIKTSVPDSDISPKDGHELPNSWMYALSKIPVSLNRKLKMRGRYVVLYQKGDNVSTASYSLGN